MPFVADLAHLEACRGDVVPDGHCVALVRHATGAPATARWRRGAAVSDAICAPGTAIATFSAAGHYENRTDGGSHACLLLGETPAGLRVLDQWKGRAVGERLIRFKNGAGPAADDADRYFVIEAVPA